MRATDQDTAEQRGLVLAEALQNALDQGHHPLAQRLATAAMRLDTHRPKSLTEQLARFRMIDGDVEHALALIDLIQHRNASQRALRAVILLRLGREAEASLELLPHDARTHASNQCNTIEQLLRALLELNPARPTGNDGVPTSLEMSVLEFLETSGRDDATMPANERFNRLAQHLLFPRERKLLQLLFASLGEATPIPSIDERTVQALADDLTHAPDLIEPLVVAQRVAFDEPSARLLLESVRRLAPSTIGVERQTAVAIELRCLIEGPPVARQALEEAISRLPDTPLLKDMLRSMDAGKPPRAFPVGGQRGDVLATIGPNVRIGGRQEGACAA